MNIIEELVGQNYACVYRIKFKSSVKGAHHEYQVLALDSVCRVFQIYCKGERFDAEYREFSRDKLERLRAEVLSTKMAEAFQKILTVVDAHSEKKILSDNIECAVPAPVIKL